MLGTNNFNREIDCVYKGDQYSVRDNGEVKRLIRIGKRIRKYDDQWTFGNPCAKTGYMLLASNRIHRIVATAFHGEPPTKNHVVDHIDTNKQNNRPENLRWVTRLENVLLNPITVKRIETTCGCSVEEFLADPSKYRDKFKEPNYSWMCTVTKEEAQNSLKRLLNWAESDKQPSGGSLGQWIFNRNIPVVPDFIEALNPNAIQKKWNTPSYFPLCPRGSPDKPILAYFTNLAQGKVFSRNQYSTSIISKFAMSVLEDTLWVLSQFSNQDSVKPWSLAQVTFEDNLYVHSSLGTFFKEDGAEKYFTLAQGLEWTGGETFDDLV